MVFADWRVTAEGCWLSLDENVGPKSCLWLLWSILFLLLCVTSVTSCITLFTHIHKLLHFMHYSLPILHRKLWPIQSHQLT